ncbi:MAG: CrcB family protein [Propionicimonas sp.]|nr:CrcB family protein [Propionicimonas sp.]
MVNGEGSESVRPSALTNFFTSPILLILVGGSLGTSIRYGLEAWRPAVPGEWPWATFVINLTGALILGTLLGWLSLSGPDAGWRRALRLGVGTGVMGGYTTYSTFSVETVSLLRHGAWLVGVGYALASVVAGVALAFLGLRLGGGLVRRGEGGPR